MNKFLANSGILPTEILLLKEIEMTKQKIKECRIVSEKDILIKRLKELNLKYDIQIEARRRFLGLLRLTNYLDFTKD